MFEIASRQDTFAPNPQSIWMPTDIKALILAMNTGRSGVIGDLGSNDHGCGVEQSFPLGMSVAVEEGLVRNDSGDPHFVVGDPTLTIAAAHATMPRVDIVTVDDDGELVVTQGTPATVQSTPTSTGPEPPEVPDNHVLLAMVLVPAAATQIIDDYITDKRVPVGGRIFANALRLKSPSFDDLVANGGFDDDTEWTHDGSWTLGGGGATHTPGSTTALTQDPLTEPLIPGKRYKLEINISAITAGEIDAITLGGADAKSGDYDVEGTFISTVEAVDATGLSIVPFTNWDGTFGRIRVTRLPDEDAGGIDWEIPYATENCRQFRIWPTDDGDLRLQLSFQRWNDEDNEWNSKIDLVSDGIRMTLYGDDEFRINNNDAGRLFSVRFVDDGLRIAFRDSDQVSFVDASIYVFDNQISIDNGTDSADWYRESGALGTTHFNAPGGMQMQMGVASSAGWNDAPFSILSTNFQVSDTINSNYMLWSTQGGGNNEGLSLVGYADDRTIGMNVIADGAAGFAYYRLRSGAAGAFDVYNQLDGSTGVVASTGAVRYSFDARVTSTVFDVPPVNVAALPGSPAAGWWANVNNALVPVVGAPVVGGGAAFASVMYNGVNWVVFVV